MRVISINTNGIRAASRKGFFEWLAKQGADFVCVQETKAQIDQLQDPIFHPQPYVCNYYDAQKKGYSGTAIYSKKEPDQITTGLGWEVADTEGRYIQADFGDLSIASLYLPSGSSKDHRQELKMQFLDLITPMLKDMVNASSRREFIICGDWNIVHKEIDIKNWKSNQKNSGCLPEERAWLDDLFGPMGFVDAFREVNQDAGEYTWWSNRGQAWANNTGWRIDYHVATPGVGGKARAVEIYKDERFSDHAPLTIDYDYDIK